MRNFGIPKRVDPDSWRADWVDGIAFVGLLVALWWLFWFVLGW